MAESVKIRILGDATGLTKALGVAESGLGKLGGVVSGFGKAAGAAMATAAATAAAAFANGFGDAMDRQALRSVVGDDILESSANIYRDAWGESLEQVATVMAETERAFGEGANVEQLTESAFILADKFGGDVNEAMQTASELAESFGVSGEHAFDLIAAASGDMSAEVRDELGSAIKEYGGVFDELGLSSENMLTLFADFGEGGAIQLDKVGDAFKEFSIRSTDGSTATADAFALMGADMGEYQQLLLQGGEVASAATFDIIKALEGIEDPAAQAEAAIALFGTPLEDLGATAVPEFLDSVQKMGDGFKDVEGTTAALGAELGDNLRTKLEGLKRQGLDKIAATIETHVLPVVSRFVDYAIEHFPVWRETVLNAVGYVTDVVLPALSRVVETVRAKFQEVWPVIQSTVVAAVAAIVDTVMEHWPAIRDTIVQTVETIWEIIQRVWPTIQTIVTTVVTDLVELVRKHWPQIREIIVTAIETVQAVIERVTKIILALWERWGDDITTYVVNTWEIIKETVGVALDFIQGIFETFRALFDGDWSAMWDGIVSTVGAIWDALKLALEQLWENARLATEIAFDVIKEEVSAAIKAIPGLLLDAGELLFNVGKVLFAFLGRGIQTALVTASEAVWEWLKGVPGTLFDLGVDLVGLGFDLFSDLVTGISQALADVPGILLDLVLGPLDEIWNKVTDILSKVPGLGGLGGGDDPTTNRFGQDIVNRGTPGSYIDSDNNLVSLFGSSQYNNNNTAYGQGGVRDVSVQVLTMADPAAIGAAVAHEIYLANARG